MSDQENVGVALALVMVAGASTGLGAAVVFFPSIVKLASRRVLAGSLGFSAGVMTYVSFVEIFGKALGSFQDAGHDEKKAYLYTTLSFFLGVVVMMILNVLVASLLGGHGHRQSGQASTPKTLDSKTKKKKKTTREDVEPAAASDAMNPPCCNQDPVGQLENFKKMASVLENENDMDGNTRHNTNSVDQSLDMDLDIEDDFVDNLPLEDKASDLSMDDDDDGAAAQGGNESQDRKTSEENKRLVKMGMNTALAIGLHNFPEGLATFVAALDDPKVGSILAFAIAIHNIPEGLCVALPIFYATGKRVNAFMWALLSGASEVVAALLGWAILANSFSSNMYALLFGLVAGMMVVISIRELLPTAHFYDPEDTCVTYTFIAGMGLIAISLVLFQL